jgi:putative ABC transport system permease protein
MLRNYLAAALGNLGRNWFYTAITIGGLAVAFAAAILIGLYLRDEYGFDRFIPGYRDIYRVELTLMLPRQKPIHADRTQADLAGQLKLDFPEVAETARLAGRTPDLLRIGYKVMSQTVAWADPDFFHIIRLPALAGDPDAAMHAPDGVVLSHEAARKYFGQDAPIGRIIEVHPGVTAGPAGDAYHPMRVLAVLKDPPASSHLTAEIFASALAPFSITDSDAQHPLSYMADQLTYVKLKPGSRPELWDARLRAFERAHYATPLGRGSQFRFHLQPLASLHFSTALGGPPAIERATGDAKVDAGIGAVGALTVLIAGINFVTLMTARAARRAVEVGVRKAVGARRRDLVAQFMGEALIYMIAALLIAAALAELLLPRLNAFVGRDLTFDYLGDPALAAALLTGAVAAAGLAGIYPALVLSAFRPSAALKGGPANVSGSAAVRHALVVVQFAILIGLILMTATIYRQTRFALRDALRMDADQVVMALAPCNSPFQQEAARVPGVKGLACGALGALQPTGAGTMALQPGRPPLAMGTGALTPGFLELHGLHPLAGRFFSRDHGEDMVLGLSGSGSDAHPTIVLNQTAARRMGYARPADAIGKTVTWGRIPAHPVPGRNGLIFAKEGVSRIVGVVPDFTMASIRNPIAPTIYYVDPEASAVVALKLDKARIPEAMRGLERAWRRTGQGGPPRLLFESQVVQAFYKDVVTQELAIGICSGLAILIACLGLFALAAFTTERRIKEIGVRKAMGASTADVLQLLLWQFTKPVLWANLLAWPLAFWVMDQWLKGFAYRVDLPPWLFVSAAAAAVAVAWATVAFHAWNAARAVPASALRYE